LILGTGLHWLEISRRCWPGSSGRLCEPEVYFTVTFVAFGFGATGCCIIIASGSRTVELELDLDHVFLAC